MYNDGRYFCDCGYGVDLDEDLICEQCRGVEAAAFRERIAYLESAVRAMEECLCAAAPVAWLAYKDYDRPHKWEKRAEKVMRDYPLEGK